MSFHRALAQIKGNDPSFTRLHIGPQEGAIFPPTFADWGQLGIAMGQNDQIKDLTFLWNHDDVPVECKEVFFGGLVDNRSIGSIFFDPAHIVGGGAPELMASFMQRTQIEFMIVGEGSRTEDEWNATRLVLKESKSIKAIKFEIDWSDGVTRERLNPILCEMPSLFHLVIKGTNFGMKEAEALTNLLPSLKRLDLDFVNFENNGILALTRQLSVNRTLRILDFCGGQLSALGWNAVTDALCLFNDHLQEIKGAPPPAITQQLLKMNKSNDKVSIRVRKYKMDFDFIIQEHRNFNGEPLVNGFDKKVLPEMNIDCQPCTISPRVSRAFFGKSGDKTDEKESHAGVSPVLFYQESPALFSENLATKQMKRNPMLGLMQRTRTGLFW